MSQKKLACTLEQTEESNMSKEITMEELAKHNKKTDCWMAINGKVYDVTDYMKKHPGGAGTIMRGAGKDATAMFDEAIRSTSLKKAHTYINPDSYLKGKYVIGRLKD